MHKCKTNGRYSTPCDKAGNATHACYEMHQHISESNNVWNHSCIARGVCIPFLNKWSVWPECCVDCVNFADTAHETLFSPSSKACCSRESLGTGQITHRPAPACFRSLWWTCVPSCVLRPAVPSSWLKPVDPCAKNHNGWNACAGTAQLAPFLSKWP